MFHLAATAPHLACSHETIWDVRCPQAAEWRTLSIVLMTHVFNLSGPFVCCLHKKLFNAKVAHNVTTQVNVLEASTETPSEPPRSHFLASANPIHPRCRQPGRPGAIATMSFREAGSALIRDGIEKHRYDQGSFLARHVPRSASSPVRLDETPFGPCVRIRLGLWLSTCDILSTLTVLHPCARARAQCSV